MKFSDAHGHFHTFGEDDQLPEGCWRAICCGTHPGDWQEVLALSERDSRISPALGLHPWHLAEAQPGWQDTLKILLQENSHASIGEIGLDRTRRSPALDKQEVALRTQLDIALALGRPITLHCVRAWGRMLTVLSEVIPPEWPVILHDFRAPEEMIPQFLKREGILFSLRSLPDTRVLQEISPCRLVYESDAFSGSTSSRDLDGAQKVIKAMAAQSHLPPSEVSRLSDAALDRFLAPSPSP